MPDRSLKTARKPKPHTGSPAPSPSSPRNPSAPFKSFPFESWTRLLRQGLPLIGVAVSVGIGLLYGLSSGMIVLAGTALIVAISAIWSSLQLLAGDVQESNEDDWLLSLPGTEREQKQALLRALKDLEFERSVGKINSDDYEELKQRYRTRARQVLQAQDRELEPVRAEAEKLVTDYLRTQALSTVEESTQEKSPPASSAPAQSVDRSLCPDCSTLNDSDAVFCKKCGRRLETNHPPEDTAL